MAKEIEDLPANELVIMNPVLHRAFCSLGCEPACHECGADLQPGTVFQLVTISCEDEQTTDVMLCGKCETYQLGREKKTRPKGKGCFRVGGKVVLELNT